ncbi:Crp/Fnr family transcriptional regulator [Sedimentitalea sp. JM2-8]|uniref:Crp/Fnr family transcriptional regulator n=1 Tax=Sedimentitalea xiamensis TaxID=3050037 RepID=A0ABT7FGL7_9RHOB|nr:Crp/Fnr family transcriptional regulator [Sedimentitalea xiamensis]MDK3074218.1 Crp/Fnr family transcriptional regulator [Sedimentitalea xiamensis]
MRINDSMAGKPQNLLDHLSAPVRTCLLSKARLRKYCRGATICLQGDRTTTLKVVQSGWVKLFRVQANGDEAVLATLSDGQSFEEIEALNGGESPSSVEALSDCIVLHIDLSAICDCENAYREISAAVLAAASGHLNAMRSDIEQLKVKSGAQRLVDFIVELSQLHGDQNELELPYGKVVLAGKLGMRPESLSRAFSRLKSLGIQSCNRRIIVTDMDALKLHLIEDGQGTGLAA